MIIQRIHSGKRGYQDGQDVSNQASLSNPIVFQGASADAFVLQSLVIKPKPGRFKALFAKLTTINKKNGPFDLVICVSDLFKIPENDEEQEELDDLIAQNVEVPVRTFAMLGSFKFPPKVQELMDKKDGSICNNLELLAPNSILTLSTVANLRIANFGGVYEPTNYNSSTEDLDTQWFYAFNIVSISEAKPTKPLNATPSPYSLSTRPSQKRGLPAFGEDGFDSGPNFRFGEMEPSKKKTRTEHKDGYVCRICNTPGHLIQDCPEAAQRSGPPKDAFQPKEIGPIAHYPSLLALPSELAIPIVAEMEHYKSALKRCYEAYSASMVSFEVAKLSGRGARAGHAHLQICPVPNELADQVETMFVEEGKKQGIELVDEVALKEMKDEMKEAISYFRVGLPDGKGLVHLMKPDEKFNLQFGRITLANLLGTPDRANWKTCERSETDEKQDCRTFQKVFAAFEPKF
ncbi:hypothetical protein PGT21_008800 [Puccinia graminis f. sp. tritici]|uniref:CCHC-type domain-containing protein n=1 Tax=Puccinia graminis f. sp. tritici TaxID=56615 RepID=A0A5B0PT13_PUCGR|nr:hypothetical protein PGT21_008800 [Puccinia graminis f. sp. tritici]